MAKALDPKKIKSAQRVLEVLEYFNKDRQEGTVMDIARTFNYPQSSTSELLGCLVALGYLRRDLRARTYKPSARVAVLGAWVQPELFRHGELLPMMDAVADETGATVFMASRVGTSVQVFHAVHGGADDTVQPGETLRLLSTAPGKALLTTMDRDQVRKLVHRINAESADHLRVRADDLIAELDQVRACGYAADLDGSEAMITVLIPQVVGAEPLALTLVSASPLDEAQVEAVVQRLRAAVTRHVGLVDVSRAPMPHRPVRTESHMAS